MRQRHRKFALARTATRTPDTGGWTCDTATPHAHERRRNAASATIVPTTSRPSRRRPKNSSHETKSHQPISATARRQCPPSVAPVAGDATITSWVSMARARRGCRARHRMVTRRPAAAALATVVVAIGGSPAAAAADTVEILRLSVASTTTSSAACGFPIARTDTGVLVAQVRDARDDRPAGDRRAGQGDGIAAEHRLARKIRHRPQLIVRDHHHQRPTTHPNRNMKPSLSRCRDGAGRHQ